MCQARGWALTVPGGDYAHFSDGETGSEGQCGLPNIPMISGQRQASHPDLSDFRAWASTFRPSPTVLLPWSVSSSLTLLHEEAGSEKGSVSVKVAQLAKGRDYLGPKSHHHPDIQVTQLAPIVSPVQSVLLPSLSIHSFSKTSLGNTHNRQIYREREISGCQRPFNGHNFLAG